MFEIFLSAKINPREIFAKQIKIRLNFTFELIIHSNKTMIINKSQIILKLFFMIYT